MVSLYEDGAELEHVSELSPTIKDELARLLDKPPQSRHKGWRELAGELGYQYEVKGKTTPRKSRPFSEMLLVTSLSRQVAGLVE